MVLFLAFSLQAEVEKYGAYVGIAAFFGLAVLALLYFSQARELRRLRDWAGRAPERAQEIEARAVASAAAARRGPAPSPAPATAAAAAGGAATAGTAGPATQVIEEEKATNGTPEAAAGAPEAPEAPEETVAGNGGPPAED